MTTTIQNCDALDEQLAAYLEEELDEATRQAVNTHVTSCLRCSALVRDLHALSRDARVLPALAPSRDLWDGIATRIEAGIIPLPARRGTLQPASTHSAAERRSRRYSLGAMAAGLMAVTAGLTYALTMAFGVDPATRVTTMPRATTGDTANVAAPVVPSPQPPPMVAGVPDAVDSAPPELDDAGPSSGVTTRLVRRVRPSVEQTYDREIASLRAILTQRRNDIDPRTAAIVENSLNTIDRAIADARGALLRDPASRFLNEQLTKSLEKKLELLRTAALLPSRT